MVTAAWRVDSARLRHPFIEKNQYEARPRNELMHGILTVREDKFNLIISFVTVLFLRGLRKRVIVIKNSIVSFQ